MLLLTISVRVHRQEERLREKRKVAYMKDIVSPDCTIFLKGTRKIIQFPTKMLDHVSTSVSAHKYYLNSDDQLEDM